MSAPLPTTVCRTCGTTLGISADGVGPLCPACLLDFALDGDLVGGGSTGEDAPRRPPASTIAPVADRFAHYVLARREDGTFLELGRGGMGVTYRATDTTLGCDVALKVVNPDLVRDDHVRARFSREARVAARLRHPRVASVFFFGERAEDGQLFYAMELVEGETLHARVRRCGGLPVAQTLEIGRQVADALAAAEARGLTHRDLKPANLMLVEGEAVNVKVIDFGLAKAAAESAEVAGLTDTQCFVGTPAFASPEQHNVWQEVDARSDFYALGATLWFALTGQPPFAGRTPAEIRTHQLGKPQTLAPRMPRSIEPLLRTLLSADPADRPQTARELAAALSRCQTQPDPARHRARIQSLVWVGIAVACVALVGLLWGGGGRNRPPPAPELEKSVAVLPFENLCPDKDDAFFAAGVQNEVLTDLARLAGLRVINRSSVLGYAEPAKRPPAHEISRALNVAYLLEGSVQRDRDHLRLSLELVDAAHDRVVWAERFERAAADMFALQSEVAKTVAGKLQVQLSGTEQSALDEPPTHDLVAYELYLHGRELRFSFGVQTSDIQPLSEAARLLNEAVRRDPDFYDAWNELCLTEVNLGLRSLHDDNAAHLELAKEALANVCRLRPGAGDTFLSTAVFEYNVSHDNAKGRANLEQARGKLSNSWRLEYLTAAYGEWDSRWTEALAAAQRAHALNPRDRDTVQLLFHVYVSLRRYEEAERMLETTIATGFLPDYYAFLHAQCVRWHTGDTAETRAHLRQAAGQPDPTGRYFEEAYAAALLDRRWDEKLRSAADDHSPTEWNKAYASDSREGLTGVIAFVCGDRELAQRNLTIARAKKEEAIHQHPDDSALWQSLSETDVWLGRYEDARGEIIKAVGLTPISRNAEQGASLLTDLGLIYVHLGDKERGLALLESLVNVPHAYEPGSLLKGPEYDFLRGEPRFQAILKAVQQPVDLAKFDLSKIPPISAPDVLPPAGQMP